MGGVQARLGAGRLEMGRDTPGSQASPHFPPPLRREYRHKSNITFNDNDTVSFREYRSFQFQPDMSRGSESDYVYMPNILVLVRPAARPPSRPLQGP